MMTTEDTVTIQLRQTKYLYDETGRYRIIRPYAEEVKLSLLTPKARALAEAVDQRGREIWVESDGSIRDIVHSRFHPWFTEEEVAGPDRRTWRDWSKFPADSPMDIHEYLERHAEKIPLGWHIYGGDYHTPVPSLAAGAADRHLNRTAVLEYLRHRGRPISSHDWEARRRAGLTPPPDRIVYQRPQWQLETIETFLRTH